MLILYRLGGRNPIQSRDKELFKATLFVTIYIKSKLENPTPPWVRPMEPHLLKKEELEFPPKKCAHVSVEFTQYFEKGGSRSTGSRHIVEERKSHNRELFKATLSIESDSKCNKLNYYEILKQSHIKFQNKL